MMRRTTVAVVLAAVSAALPGGFESDASVDTEVLFQPEICTDVVGVGSFVQIHYKGTLEDGTVFDDSSIPPGRPPMQFEVGGNPRLVIEGMEVGIKGMCVGEKRRIVIPPDLGYGKEGNGKNGLIPGDSTLHFDIELVKLLQVSKPTTAGRFNRNTHSLRPYQRNRTTRTICSA